MVIHARAALLPGGWADNVRLTIADGRIVSVETGIARQPGDEALGLLLPAMPNLHSHAFQRGMAGLTEYRGPAEDDFWSWRKLMYLFALGMNAEQVEAISALAFVEMLEAGFGRVGEFHYLHHDRDGRPYTNIAELSERIAAAASGTGIGLTLLPVFYAHADFGGALPLEGQRRFITQPDAFARLVDGARKAIAGLPEARLGIAPHSLRAATPDEIGAILPLAGNGPVHIHAAEQVKEVETSLATLGARPVEWLLGNMPVDRHWCLIHSTHVTADETARLAASGATAGLCPVTEANLGDGVFPARDFAAAGGHFGIGTDSNVLIGVAEELRQLEYAQRLTLRQRNVLAEPGGSTARFLFERALAGGGRALDAATGIAAGNPADLVSLKGEALAYGSPDEALGLFLFSRQVTTDCVWVNGKKCVEGGTHRHGEAIRRKALAAISELVAD
jgi:formimidoylglutamate deiminase